MADNLTGNKQFSGEPIEVMTNNPSVAAALAELNEKVDAIILVLRQHNIIER